jgi:hypothetical protein
MECAVIANGDAAFQYDADWFIFASDESPGKKPRSAIATSAIMSTTASRTRYSVAPCPDKYFRTTTTLMPFPLQVIKGLPSGGAIGGAVENILSSSAINITAAARAAGQPSRADWLRIGAQPP